MLKEFFKGLRVRVKMEKKLRVSAVAENTAVQQKETGEENVNEDKK